MLQCHWWRRTYYFCGTWLRILATMTAGFLACAFSINSSFPSHSKHFSNSRRSFNVSQIKIWELLLVQGICSITPLGLSVKRCCLIQNAFCLMMARKLVICYVPFVCENKPMLCISLQMRNGKQTETGRYGYQCWYLIFWSEHFVIKKRNCSISFGDFDWYWYPWGGGDPGEGG